MDFVAPEFKNGKKNVRIQDFLHKVSRMLVSHYMSFRQKFVFNAICTKELETQWALEISAKPNGFILFNFASVEDCSGDLEGPQLYGGHALVLRRSEKRLELRGGPLQSIPIRIRYSNLGLHLRSQSILASMHHR